MPHNIVIGNPLVPLKSLGITNFEDTITDTERFLPRLLVKHGFSKSTSEIKRNRPDLWIELDKPDFFEVRLGKKRVWIVVGE